VVDENFDIGGRGMLSGGRVQLGGGHALQQKLNIQDSPDQIFADWVRFDHAESKFTDRELIRVFADENVAAWDFLIENGVEFIERPIRSPDVSTVDRIFVTKEWHIPSEIIAPRRNRNGSGLVRRLEQSARKKGAQIFLKHKMTSIVRERHNAGRVLGITTINGSNVVNIQARKGIIIATGGHSGNVNFRRIFDPRLTEEYQQACEPYVHQGADGELAAMDIGASLWATAIQTIDAGAAITKTRHVGCRWGYSSLVYEPDSPMFRLARATGLTVKDWQNLILVNQNGARFWNEVDGSHKFFAAAMAYNGDKTKLNGGGPIWAIFDADGVTREKWKPEPPHVDPDGYFYSADTIPELAAKIKNPHQKQPIPGTALQETVNRYNAFVAEGVDQDFKKPTPMHKIATPPFYAAWSTPILHDTLTGLRTNTNSEVIDLRGEVIPGLYCAGESQGGFAQHGLARCIVFGRIAGRHAAQRLDNGRRAAQR
jgi:urocanate reductase